MSRSARLLTAAYAVSQFRILQLLYPVRSGAVPLQWTTDEARVREVMEGWSLAERERYRRHLGPDTLHPFVYVAMLIAQERSLRGDRNPVQGRPFAAGAVATGVFDLIENGYHDRHLRGHITDGSARRSGLASRAKWIASAGLLVRLALLARARARR